MGAPFSYRAIKLVPDSKEAQLIQRGWLIAVAELIRHHGQINAAREMLADASIGGAEVRAAGLPLWDVRQLEKALPQPMKPARRPSPASAIKKISAPVAAIPVAAACAAVAPDPAPSQVPSEPVKLQPVAKLPATPPAAPSEPAPKLKFRSWAEDYKRPEPLINRDALAYQRRLQGHRKSAERIAASNPLSIHNRAIATAAREAAANEHRLNDPIERAKAFLQRKMPVYAATVAGGRAGSFVVGTKLVTKDELLAMATAKGWTPEASNGR